MPLNMLVLLIIGKNGLGNPRTSKSNAVAVKERPKKLSAKITKAGEKEYGTLLADFEKNYAAIAPYALARDYFMETVQRNTELLYRTDCIN
jgi:hypothetical protein